MQTTLSDLRRSFFPVIASSSVLVLALVFNYVAGAMTGPSSSEVVLGASTSSQTELSATLVVNAEGVIKTYRNIDFNEGTTAMDFLRLASVKSTFRMNADSYKFGTYLHTVNGTRVLNNQYWMLLVNGVEPNSTIDNYLVRDEDVIELKLSEY